MLRSDKEKCTICWTKYQLWRKLRKEMELGELGERLNNKTKIEKKINIVSEENRIRKQLVVFLS